MSTPEMIYLGYTVAAFVIFGVVLFGISTYTNLKR